MRKRLEEAAEEYAIKHRADYLPEDCYASEYKEGFLAGAKYGYKVAIASVREWMYDNARNYVDGVFWYDHMMRDFETFMSKLFGENK